MSESADDGAAGVGDRPGTEVAADDPEAGAIAFVTTEHFTLHGARSQTISESTGRASIFLASVSGGLIALGLVATATHVGTAFYVFGLILLPTLAFVGLVIFNAFCRPESRIAATRSGSPASAATTSNHAPELTRYLLSVPAEHRLEVQGLPTWRLQGFLTVAGMTAVIISVLAGATAGLLAVPLSDHSLAASLIIGSLFAAGVMAALMRYQAAAWRPTDQAADMPEV